MLHCIAHLLDPLLRLLWPPPYGRHRPPRPGREPECRPAAAPPRPALPPRPCFRGEDSPLVRPYLVAHERRRAETRHRVLRFAVHGVDLGPRVVRGTEAAA
ncbi:hypothetical protein RND61_03550 [Streptomyces sp. TRM76323]|uniref:Uncharacterized protein n=1 Tax=Streptomyces tamarix TaxID=3078565 RepID=A0ABU3QEF3_9ACTN|nr:hypothetical protein [Streptomyces tamarix]MDT9681155.1 hypothetical protein [Streptomyces tamarix]